MTALTVDILFGKWQKIIDVTGHVAYVLQAVAHTPKTQKQDLLDVIGEFSDIKIRVRKWFFKCTITIPENLKIAILVF